MPTTIGVVLAGGLSSRMDGPKPLLNLPNGQTFLQNALALLVKLTEAQIVAGGDPRIIGQLDPPQYHIEDLHPGEGPLAGIEAALTSELGSGYLIIATDQPRLSESLLQRLLIGDAAQIHAFRVDGNIVPLPVYVPQLALTELRKFMRGNLRAIRPFILENNPELNNLPSKYLVEIRSINTPEEYEDFWRNWHNNASY